MIALSHLIYLAIRLPPAARSCAYRMRGTANRFCAKGWDVTVVNLCRSAWHRDHGIDDTLTAKVHPRVQVVELSLAREDLETDIRKYSEDRALSPARWARAYRAEQRDFPEPIFGRWRGAPHAIATWDWSVVAPRFDRLLLNNAAERGRGDEARR